MIMVPILGTSLIHWENVIFELNLLYLSIVATRGDDIAIRRVGQGVHVVVVPLLLEDVRLALPFPHQQLAESRAAERQPLTRGVHGH